MKDEWLEIFNPDHMTRTRSQVWKWRIVTWPLEDLMKVVARTLDRFAEIMEKKR